MLIRSQKFLLKHNERFALQYRILPNSPLVSFMVTKFNYA